MNIHTRIIFLRNMIGVQTGNLGCVTAAQKSSRYNGSEAFTACGSSNQHMAEETNKPQKAEDEVTGKAYDGRLMMRLGRYLGPYRPQATISVIAVILKAASDVVGPYLVKVGLDRYLTAKATVLDGGVPTNWLAKR